MTPRPDTPDTPDISSTPSTPTAPTPSPPSPHADLPPDALASPLARAGLEVARRLQAAGHQACFVGGCVRNALLGLPVKDIDLATSARPDQVAALFERCESVGAHFGVQIVVLEDFQFEVATFRAEGAYVDHRRPTQVRYGSFDDDWRRRDFTVNAIYYDPLARRLLDPAGGRDDLAQRRLRAVGDPDLRFAEDALRLLRAVRFAGRYDLTLEPATAAAIRRHGATLRAISIERVADELTAILTGPRPGRAMHLMDDLGLWTHVIPEIEPMKGCPQPPEFHPEGDVFVHTALVLDLLHEAWGGAPPPELAWAALLHDVGKPPTLTHDGRIRFPEHQRVGAAMADQILRRLRLPNRIREIAVQLVAGHMRFMDVADMKQSKLRRFLGQPHFDQHLALHLADCRGSHGKLDNYRFCLDQAERFRRDDAQAALLPEPLLTGHDLIALGLKPGPAFSRILEAVRDEQLEGHLADRDAALAWLRDHRADFEAI